MPSLNRGFLNSRNSCGQYSPSTGSVHKVFSMLACTATIQYLLFSQISIPPNSSVPLLPLPAFFSLPIKFSSLSDFLCFTFLCTQTFSWQKGEAEQRAAASCPTVRFYLRILHLAETVRSSHAQNRMFSFIPYNTESQNLTQSGDTTHEIPIRKLRHRQIV